MRLFIKYLHIKRQYVVATEQQERICGKDKKIK